MITHHPDIATLMAFSAGTLPEPYAAVIATHLAMSEQARGIARNLETLGGALLEKEAEVTLNSAALERLMSALDSHAVEPRPHVIPGELPLPLRSYVPGGLESVRWQWTGPGVGRTTLAWGKDGRSRLMLMRVAAGCPVPEHAHGGQELTLILRGAYRDRFGLFGIGDIADHDEDVEHQPIAEPGEDCICLVAVDARLAFRDWLVRLLQPLVGM